MRCTLLRLADWAKGKEVLLFNVRAPEVSLRQEDCRTNVLHTAPDRAMLADALAQTGVRHVQCGDLGTALSAAAQDAQPGEVVLLSPACASYDQFRDFEERGDEFRRLVEELR